MSNQIQQETDPLSEEDFFDMLDSYGVNLAWEQKERWEDETGVTIQVQFSFNNDGSIVRN